MPKPYNTSGGAFRKHDPRLFTDPDGRFRDFGYERSSQRMLSELR